MTDDKCEGCGGDGWPGGLNCPECGLTRVYLCLGCDEPVPWQNGHWSYCEECKAAMLPMVQDYLGLPE